MKFTTNSEKESILLAEDFAKKIKGGDTIGLIGELGAGKTVFTKGLAKALNIKQNITSPTFVVMKVYDVSAHPEIKKLCHIDAYRLNNEADLEAIGALEYIKRKDTVTVIEWADKIKKILPKKTRLLYFENMKEPKKRKIKFH